MKKLFVLGFVILAFAATAYSQAPKLEFKASGYIDMRTNMWKWNNDNHMGYLDERNQVVDVVPLVNRPNGGEWNKTAAYVEQRGRLRFDAIMGKELSGTIFFEMDSRTWGDESGTRNQIGYYGGDRAGLEIKNLYFDVAVPYIPVPITFRAGLQPFGDRPGVFWFNDATGVTVGVKMDPVQINGYWCKGMEGRIADTSDDIDAYGLKVTAKIEAITIGAWGYYFNMRQYPFGSVTNGTAYGTSNLDSQQMKIYWLGFYADGKLGPVVMNFDFIYDSGKIKNKWDTAVGDVKYSGWATRIKFDFPWEMFNFGVIGTYATGSDLRKTDGTGQPGKAVLDPNYAAAGFKSSKVSGYVVPPYSETGGAFAEGECFFGATITNGFTGIGYSGSGASRVSRGSNGGLWLAKLYGSYKLTPDYKMTLQGLYIGDTAKNGDTFGTSLGNDGGRKNNSSIGWELDLINDWNIYKNLNLKFGGGLLFPGDALKFWDSVKGKNVKPETPWIFLTALTYSF